MPNPFSDTEGMDPAVWRITAVALFGSLLSMLDATIVNVSLTSLAHELHCGISTIQWVTSGYLLALALVLPINGWLLGRVSAKTIYLCCFVSFTVSSVLCGLAWSANSLIGFRVLQGISGGLLAPMAQFMMARAAGRHMARVVGYAAIPVLFAPILGPVIAGAILQHASWRWLFLVNLPVGVVALLLAIFLLPKEGVDSSKRDLDVAGLALISPGLVLFLYGLDHVSETTGILSLIAGLALLGMFLRHAVRKKERALIDLRLFKGKVFPVSCATQSLTNGISFSGQMLIPVYLIRACGLSPSAAGWSLAPLGLGMILLYPSLGFLTGRFGIRRVAAGGALVGLVGTLPFLFLASHTLIRPALYAALFIRGAGMATVGIPSITSAYASVPKNELAMATTSMNVVQRLGGPTMTTVCATFLAWRLGLGRDPATMKAAFTLTFGLLCLLHLAVFLTARRQPRYLDQAITSTAEPEERAEVLEAAVAGLED